MGTVRRVGHTVQPTVKMLFMFVSLVIFCGISTSSVPNGDIISYIRSVENKVAIVQDQVVEINNKVAQKIESLEENLTKKIEKTSDASKRSWKLQASNVCFGARNSGFGKFTLKNEGRISAVKLVHRSGFVSCVGPARKDYQKYKSKWGCGSWWSDTRELAVMVYVTDKYDRVVSPKTLVENKSNVRYTLVGFDSNSKELVLSYAFGIVKICIIHLRPITRVLVVLMFIYFL